MNIKTQQLSPFDFELFKRFSSHDVLAVAHHWKDILVNLTSTIAVEISGELRRGKPSISHIDFVVSSNNIPRTAAELTKIPDIHAISKKAWNCFEIQIKNGISLFVWLVVPSEFSTALFYTTGPGSHTDWISAIAAKNNKHVSFQGCWNDRHWVEINSEEEIYRFLELPFFPPEVREMDFSQDRVNGQFFQNLIKHTDIRSDLHTHTNWSDGENTLDEMVSGAIDRNLSAIAITDHSPRILRSRYQGPEYLLEQQKIMDQLDEKYNQQISILKGVEVDILPDGSLDLTPEYLEKMDIVVASLHVKLDQPQGVITERLIRAIENPFVDIIGHPGGRLYPMHDMVNLDWERVYHAAAFNQVALEINSHKAHPLFDDQKVRMAVAAGVPICLNSDAHSTAMLDQSIFGINIARRAGLGKSQVMNTWSPGHLKIWLQRRHKPTAAAR